MGSQHFFHPDHIIPGTCFKAAFCKMGDCFVAQLFMKRDAAGIRVGDAGIQVQDILLFQDVLQSQIQPGACLLSPAVFAYIDGCLGRPDVSLSLIHI